VNRLSPQPVAFYAATFFLVNLTYIALIWELIDPASTSATKVRAIMHARSLVTLCVFAAATLVALKYPVIGLAMCIGCLILYLRPEPPWAQAADGVGSEDT